MRRPRPSRRARTSHAGASALEFAFTFPLLLLVLFALVHYGLVFALQISMTAAAGDAARATLGANPASEDHQTAATTLARAAAVRRLDWLPAAEHTHVLGDTGEAVSVSFTSDPTLGPVVEITILYRDYPSQPLLPVFTLPGLGSIPPVPSQLAAHASIAL